MVRKNAGILYPSKSCPICRHEVSIKNTPTEYERVVGEEPAKGQALVRLILGQKAVTSQLPPINNSHTQLFNKDNLVALPSESIRRESDEEEEPYEEIEM